MDNATIEKMVFEIIARELNKDIEDITLFDTIANYEELDSLDYVVLSMALEEFFNVELDIIGKPGVKVKDIVDEIKAKVTKEVG